MMEKKKLKKMKKMLIQKYRVLKKKTLKDADF